MTILILNPNSTDAMTDAMVTAAERAAPSLRFDGWTSHDGPPAIEGRQDGAAATPPLLDLVARASEAGASGIVIGCFDDTGLSEAARIAACPVVGLGQASYHYAALRHWTFSVVTTLAVSVPVLEENIHRQGLSGYLSRVRASDVPVLALEADPAASGRSICKEALTAQAHDDVDAVILGCAGMVQVFEDVRQAATIETIDPVSCAARSFLWLQG